MRTVSYLIVTDDGTRYVASQEAADDVPEERWQRHMDDAAEHWSTVYFGDPELAALVEVAKLRPEAPAWLKELKGPAAGEAAL